MSEMQSVLDRLEARIDYQSARIDAIYRTLERHGMAPRPLNARSGDAFADDLLELSHLPLTGSARRQPTRCRARFHIGDATGV